MANLLVISLFNLCIHLSLLRVRVVVEMNTVVSGDDGAPTFPIVHDYSSIFFDGQWVIHLSIHVYNQRSVCLTVLVNLKPVRTVLVLLVDNCA